MKLFSIDELLSDAPKFIGAIQFPTSTPIFVEEIRNDPIQAGVVWIECKSPHNLALGDRFYLAATGCIDGFYLVQPHPNEAENKTRSFSIEARLPHNFSRDQEISCYAIAEWQVSSTAHISYAASLELDQIQLSQRKLRQYLVDLQARSQELQLKNAELLLKVPDMSALEAQLGIDYNSMPKSEALAKLQVVLSDVDLDLIAKLRMLRGEEANLSLEADRHTLETDKERMRLQAREIEILCSMPSGHLLLIMDDGNFQQRINAISTYIVEAMNEANPPSDSPPKPESLESAEGKSEAASSSSSMRSQHSRRTATSAAK